MDATWTNAYTPTMDDGPEISEVVLSFVPASEAIDELAAAANFWWKIDAHKRIHFRDRKTYEAPWPLTPSDIREETLRMESSNPEYRNVQFIRGFRARTDEQEDRFRGNGEIQSFPLAYAVAKPPTVEVSIGGGAATQQTIGIRGIDEDRDWYYRLGEKDITQERTEDALTADDRLIVTYIGEYPSVTMQEDTDKIADRFGMEGFGTGRVETAATVADLESVDAAQTYARQKIEKWGEINTVVEYETFREGLEAGMIQMVTIPQYGIDGEEFLIEKVAITERNGMPRFSVRAIRGPVHGSWTKYFQRYFARRPMRAIRIGAGAEDILVLPISISKDWTEEERPNIFTLKTPTPPEMSWGDNFGTAETWNDYGTDRWVEADETEYLLPAALEPHIYPQFALDQRIRFCSLMHADVEVYRKKLTQAIGMHTDEIETVTYIDATEFTGPVDEIAWIGGLRATPAEGTGVEIDRQEYAATKTEIEAWQIERTDRRW